MVSPLSSEKLGERLFHTRQEAGLGMRALAKKAGVGEATINETEKGRRIPGADIVERLARALGVNAAWLAYGEGRKEAERAKTDVAPRRKGDFL
jgi:transcriptional regulator with XRE-family HTH domain